MVYLGMNWEVEVTDEFSEWFKSLDDVDRKRVTASVDLLEMVGAHLGHPHSSGIKSSRHSHMRELRVQSKGQPLRVIYAFDPRRTAILLIGGNKVGQDLWYEEFVPKADDLYDEHLETLRREGLDYGKKEMG